MGTAQDKPALMRFGVSPGGGAFGALVFLYG